MVWVVVFTVGHLGVQGGCDEIEIVSIKKVRESKEDRKDLYAFLLHVELKEGQIKFTDLSTYKERSQVFGFWLAERSPS